MSWFSSNALEIFLIGSQPNDDIRALPSGGVLSPSIPGLASYLTSFSVPTGRDGVLFMDLQPTVFYGFHPTIVHISVLQRSGLSSYLTSFSVPTGRDGSLPNSHCSTTSREAARHPIGPCASLRAG